MRTLELPDVPAWSKIGLGTWQFGSREWGYGTGYADREATAIVARALELGVTFFDTAEVYGVGRSERILGAALGERRDDVYLASKVFPALPLAPIVEQRGRASAERLGVRRIDLYQVHWPNPLVPDGTIMEGMRRLHEAGVIAEVGVSNYPRDRWLGAEAALGRRVLSDQVRYSLVDRRPQEQLLPYAAQHGRVLIAYSPLAQGLLSGRYTPDSRPTNGIRAANPLFLAENLELARPLLDTLREVAAAHDATPAQIALAWVIRSPHVVAIPGASSVAQVESNAAAADLDLAPDEVTALSAAAAAFRPVTGLSALPALVRSRRAS